MNKLVALLLTIAFLILTAILFFGSTPNDYLIANALFDRSLTNAWDLGHILFFAGVGFIVQRVFKPASVLTFILILSALLVVGLLIEGVQTLVGRSGSWRDFGSDALGLSLGFSSAYAATHSTARWVLVVSLLCLLVVLVRPVQQFADELKAKKAFPVLADFSSPLQISRFDFIRAVGEIDNRRMRVDFLPALYSSVELSYLPANWEDFVFLNIGLRNFSDEELELNCRIHDWQHEQTGMLYEDRFHQVINLSPGHQVLKIELDAVRSAPKSRLMNMEAIVSLMCFTKSLQQVYTVEFDKLWLSES